MLVLVVPCFNERARLQPARYEAALAERDDLAFLFVDDGSTDGTPEVLEALAARWTDRVGTLPLEENVGKAEAVRAGVFAARRRWAQTAWIGFWDADLATPLTELEVFLKAIKDRPDARFFAGARVMLMGRAIERRAVRHVLGRGFATFASLALNLRVYDTQCGAKIFDVALAEELFAEKFMSRWLFDVELFARLVQAYGVERAESWVVEVPLTAWKDVEGSKLKSKDFVRAAAELAAIWQRYPR